MRSYGWIVVVAACDAGPMEMPVQTGPHGRAPDGSPVVGHTLVLPAEFASEHTLPVYADLADGLASARNELDLGLADGWPERVTLASDSAYVFGDACAPQPGPVTWRSITAVDGDAARIEVVDGALVIESVAEGELTARIVGEIGDQECGDTNTVEFEHELVVRVRRVTGVVIESFHQVLSGCEDPLVLPTDTPLWAPEARPLDGAGAKFAAINAPRPVDITLHSPGELRLDDANRLWAAAGEVTLAAATELPVAGLRALRIVGPEALTEVDAGLYLQRAAGKGTVSERIVDGAEYPLFFPDRPNLVDVRVEAATTEFGELCANVPGQWFATTTATPGRCTPDVAAAEPGASPVAVAQIVFMGECRLAVTIPGTALAWTTRFTTTP